MSDDQQDKIKKIKRHFYLFSALRIVFDLVLVFLFAVMVLTSIDMKDWFWVVCGSLLGIGNTGFLCDAISELLDFVQKCKESEL